MPKKSDLQEFFFEIQYVKKNKSLVEIQNIRIFC